MINSSIFKRLAIAFSVILFISCDSDFNELGSNIIEDDIHHDNMSRIIGEVIAYDKPTGAVQSNNLPLNSLGIYNNPAFGKTTAHFVTQVKLTDVNPTFTTNVEVDTVYLYVPYFSTLESTDANGASTYTLDSIYGNTDASMRLNVYENGFFLRDLDPSAPSATVQKYFSDQKTLIDNAKNPTRLNDSDNLSQNDEFKISSAQIERKVGDKVVERFAPGIYLNLNTDFFQQKIINSPSKLANQNLFKEWFRGVYFNIQPNSDNGAMATMNFNLGKIVVMYEQDAEAGTEGTPSSDRERKTITLDMNGSSTTLNRVNFFENEYNPLFTSALLDSNEDDGDDRLFVKGGEGSVAFIELKTDAFQQFIINPANQDPKILVNEANLKFYVDHDFMGTEQQGQAIQPLRLYLFDVNNKRPVFDYFTDNTSNSANAKYSKVVHGGLLQRDANGWFYKIRITNHINNIINKDSTNVKLGLVVTESINFTGNADLKNPITGDDVDFVPAASVINPLGTSLYGNDIPETNESDYDKRLKLEIFYTKPN